VARSGSVSFNDAGLNALRDRVSRLASSEARTIADRASKTLARRLPVRAAELVAELVLNVPRAKARGYLSAKASGDQVTLFGVERRIPLHDFTGTRYGGRKTPGAVVKKWRDSGPETYSAARAQSAGGLAKGGAFAIKGRGVKGGIYQRINKEFKAGGTWRDVHVLRLGPSFARALTDKKHGDIMPALVSAGREVLRAELARLLKVSG
jgi:hypothetical protein